MIEKLVAKYSIFLPPQLNVDGSNNKAGRRRNPGDMRLTRRDTGTPPLSSDKPYQSIVGSLIYISQLARPDICYATNRCAQYMSDPGELHWQALMQILIYLRESSSLVIRYIRTNENINQLTAYSDSDWRGCRETMRSTSGWCHFMNGGLIAWGSKRQPLVADSSQYAEIMAIHKTKNVTLHCRAMKNFFERKEPGPTAIHWTDHPVIEAKVGKKRPYQWNDGVTIEQGPRYDGQMQISLGDEGNAPTPTLIDNMGSIRWSHNPVGDSQRMKHVRGTYHSIREETTEFGSIEPIQIASEDNYADIFTKYLTSVPFLRFRNGWTVGETQRPGLLCTPLLDERPHCPEGR
jgi:hypothetical protein